jgi:hypothetical protein
LRNRVEVFLGDANRFLEPDEGSFSFPSGAPLGN